MIVANELHTHQMSYLFSHDVSCNHSRLCKVTIYCFHVWLYFMYTYTSVCQLQFLCDSSLHSARRVQNDMTKSSQARASYRHHFPLSEFNKKNRKRCRSDVFDVKQLHVVIVILNMKKLCKYNHISDVYKTYLPYF